MKNQNNKTPEKVRNKAWASGVWSLGGEAPFKPRLEREDGYI